MTTEPTPADVRALIAQAEALDKACKELADRFSATTAEPVRRQAHVITEAASWLTNLTEDLERVAGKLTRIRSARGHGQCRIPWGVCPDHGNTLKSSGGKSWCMTCGREWNYDRAGLPCGEPVTSVVVDMEGTEFTTCAGHTIDVEKRLINATIRPLNGED
jgi:hypothetical protein